MTRLSIVPAGAGAGKTHHIQTTLARWVRDGMVRPERILAVTFTEAAAGELRQRIRASLIADGNLSAALAIDRAYVSTIHGLGRRLLVEHAFASGASPQQRLIAEDEQDLLIRRAIEENTELAALARDLGAYGYKYNFATGEAAEDMFRKDLLGVIGKLRALGPRGSHHDLVEHVAAAVREGYGAPIGRPELLAAGLQAAVAALLTGFPNKLTVGTGNATAEKIFKDNFLDLCRAQRMFEKGEQSWQAWQKLRSLRQTVRGCPTPVGYDDLASAVMAAADKLVHHPGPLEDAVAHAQVLVAGAQYAMADYEARKRALGVIDYSDMVTNAARLVNDDPAILAAILEEVDCVIIDEFQDTNPIQFTFLWTLARQARHALIVGDTKQAIMAFQGADPRLTEALTRQFPTSPLTSNWRSDARIMAFVNALGPCLFGAEYTALGAQREARTGTALEVIQLAGTRKAKNAGKPQHFIADRIAALLASDGETIVDRHTGHERALEPRDIALLCPTHALCMAYAQALRALGLPVRVAENGWWQSPIVQAAVFALRYAAHPDDSHAALCLATLGPDAIPIDVALRVMMQGDPIAAPTLIAIGALWPDAPSMPVDRMVHAVIAATDLRDWCDRLDDPAQMRADLLRFEAEAAEFVAAHRDTREASGFYGDNAGTFLGWLENKVGLKDGDKRPAPSGAEADGIEIVTWHSAKGREWPVVVVCGLDSQHDPRPATFTTCFPGFDDLDHVIEHATLTYAPALAAPEATTRYLDALRPSAEETARRLLYVALTRARDRLILEWPMEDKAKDLPGPITARRLLAESCGMRLEANTIAIGPATFSARMLICSKDVPAAVGDDQLTPAPLSHREPRFALARGATYDPVAVVSPSLTQTTSRALPTVLETRTICAGINITSERLAAATDKGTAIHEALRILLLRPDLAHRVAAHCRIDEDDVQALSLAAIALRAVLTELGFPDLHVEQSLEIPLADGTTQCAIIDLIAKGPEGYIIVDHKSGDVTDHSERFAQYWPQMAAYVHAVETIDVMPVRKVAIFWANTGQITVAAIPQANVQQTV